MDRMRAGRTDYVIPHTTRMSMKMRIVQLKQIPQSSDMLDEMLFGSLTFVILLDNSNHKLFVSQSKVWPPIKKTHCSECNLMLFFNKTK